MLITQKAHQFVILLIGTIKQQMRCHQEMCNPPQLEAAIQRFSNNKENNIL
jgi:hypothetical protein